VDARLELQALTLSIDKTDMAKPKLILDTNVCDILARKSSGEVNRFQKRIASEFRLMASPETFIELLVPIKYGQNEDHFKKDQRRIRLMAGGGAPRFLRFPGAFALHSVLGLASPVTKFNPNHFNKWFNIVVAARSRSQLLNVRVRRSTDTRLLGLNPDIIIAQHQEGKTSHEEWLRTIMSRPHKFPPPEMWVKMMAKELGHDLTDGQVQKLAEGLDAAYKYQKYNFTTASNTPDYKATKHEGDWTDNQQLYYLSDPTMFLLTDDSGIRNKCNQSEQANRILLLQEF
jgi:hypothetical protein